VQIIRHKRQSIELGHISIELRLSLRHAAVLRIKSKWETLSFSLLEVVNTTYDQ